MYNQAYNQLPVRVDALMYPMLNIGPNNPPFVPPVDTDQQMRQWVPFIAGAAAAEVQGRAQENALRTFMFNRYAFNNFQNAEFAQLVADITDWVVLQFAVHRRFTNIQEAIGQGVVEVTQMVASMELHQFPALEQYLQPGLVHKVRQMIGVAQNVGQEIRALKQNGRWPGAQPAQYGYQPQQQPTYQQPAQYGYQPQYSYQPQPAPYRSGHDAQSSTGLFRTGGQPAQAGNGNGVNINSDRWSDTSRYNINNGQDTTQAEVLKQPFDARDTAPAGDLTTALETPAEPVLVPIGEAKWRPNPSAPIWYLPAYNPLTHELFIQVTPEGVTQPTLKPRTAVLDYNRHKLSTVFGRVPETVNLGNTAEIMQHLERGVKELRGEKPEEAEDNPHYKPSAYVHKNTIVETSEAGAWLTASLERLSTEFTNGNPDIYRMYAQILDPIVGMQDETETVKNLSGSHTYLELREKLKGAVNEMSAALFGAANRKMTELINRILKQNMSIPKLSIDDFINDLDDLLQHLENKYGEAVKNAFLTDQKKHIRNTFGILEQDIADKITEDLLDGREYGEQKPAITYVLTTMSLTLINARSYELELDLAPEVASALTPQFTPILHDLVAALFKETEDDEHFERHLIRTTDGRVLEASRGYMNQDFYLLTLIH